MNYKLRCSVHSALFVLLSCALSYVRPQQCRSYNRQVGQCVVITTCPPLFSLLQKSPTAQELRQLQRLTCGFDQNSDPKVCCPTKFIDPPPLHSVRFSASGGEKNSVNSSTTEKTTASSSTTTTTQSTTPVSLIFGPQPVVNGDSAPDYSSHRNFKYLPTLKECSEVFVSGDRVVGGTAVEPGKFPWMARVGYQKSGSPKLTYYCAASIISKRYILTAAHCTEGLDEFIPYSVRLGENDASKDEDCNAEWGLCFKPEDYKIEKVIAHKSYSTSTKQNDISLIRVDRDISFSSFFVRPLCLPFFKEYGIENFTLPRGVDENKAVVAGWGRTVANKNEGSDKLLEVTLPLKTNQECQKIYSRRVTISPKQICAGGEVNKDSCAGDSGGPLVALKTIHEATKRTKYFQLGIVSFGPVQCGIGGLPGVYARVSQYLDWILDSIEP